MITLMMSVLGNYPEYYQILGIILTVIEVLMIIVRLMYNFAPEGSKFAKFLEHIFKGLKKSKHTISNPISDELDEKDEHKDNGEE